MFLEYEEESKMKLVKNRKGFTLIELLAVIVILGILMAFAIPSIQGIIRNSRKNTYVSTAQGFANQVRYNLMSGEYDYPPVGQFIAVKTDTIELETGSKNSTFNHPYKTDQSYVVVINDGASGNSGSEGNYVYFVAMVDDAGNGFTIVEENTISSADIKLGGVSNTTFSTIAALTKTTLQASCDRTLSYSGTNYTKYKSYPTT